MGALSKFMVFGYTLGVNGVTDMSPQQSEVTRCIKVTVASTT